MNLSFLRKPYFRFGLRTFFVVVTLLCVWIATIKTAAERQASFVQRLQGVQGTCHYDYEYDKSGTLNLNRESSVPPFLLRALGRDFFHDVVEVKLFTAKSYAYGRFLDSGSARMFDSEIHWETPATRKAIRELMEDISTLESLRTISLPAMRDLDSVFENQLSKLHQLESITILARSDLSDQGISHLKNLDNFKTISIEGSKISDASMEVFGKMENIEFLYLGGHQFTDKGTKHLANLSELKYLVLDGPAAKKNLLSLFTSNALDVKIQITDEGVRPLTNLKKLKYLSIYRTEVSDDFAKEFNAQNPTCQITR